MFVLDKLFCGQLSISNKVKEAAIAKVTASPKMPICQTSKESEEPWKGVQEIPKVHVFQVYKIQIL